MTKIILLHDLQKRLNFIAYLRYVNNYTGRKMYIIYRMFPFNKGFICCRVYVFTTVYIYCIHKTPNKVLTTFRKLGIIPPVNGNSGMCTIFTVRRIRFTCTGSWIAIAGTYIVLTVVYISYVRLQYCITFTKWPFPK